jgi:hypothetical protein
MYDAARSADFAKEGRPMKKLFSILAASFLGPSGNA